MESLERAPLYAGLFHTPPAPRACTQYGGENESGSANRLHTAKGYNLYVVGVNETLFYKHKKERV